MKKSLNILAVVFFTTLHLFAQEHDVKIYNFDNSEEMNEFRRLNLDESHANLLNPNVSKDSINQVIESWTGLHQAIGKHLKSTDFNWQIEAENISIVHRIYFRNDGKIKAHFFKVLTPELPKEVTQAFSDQLQVFDKNYQLDITRENDFAQCGKVRYPVNN